MFGILNVEHGAKRWSARAAFQRVNAPVWPSSSTNVPVDALEVAAEILGGGRTGDEQAEGGDGEDEQAHRPVIVTRRQACATGSAVA